VREGTEEQPPSRILPAPWLRQLPTFNRLPRVFWVASDCVTPRASFWCSIFAEHRSVGRGKDRFFWFRCRSDHKGRESPTRLPSTTPCAFSVAHNGANHPLPRFIASRLARDRARAWKNWISRAMFGKDRQMRTPLLCAHLCVDPSRVGDPGYLGEVVLALRFGARRGGHTNSMRTNLPPVSSVARSTLASPPTAAAPSALFTA
jgi:hypothetical protein